MSRSTNVLVVAGVLQLTWAATSLAQPAPKPELGSKGVPTGSVPAGPPDAVLRRVLGGEACALPVKPCLAADPKVVGGLIRALRERFGMTREQLAARVSSASDPQRETSGSIAQIEGGFSTPALPLLERIAAVFKVTVSTLLGGGPRGAGPGESMWRTNPSVSPIGVRANEEPCSGGMSEQERLRIVFGEYKTLVGGMGAIIERLVAVLEPLSKALPKDYDSIEKYVWSEYLEVEATHECVGGPLSAKVLKVFFKLPEGQVLGGVAVISTHRAAADLGFVHSKYVAQYRQQYRDAEFLQDKFAPGFVFQTGSELGGISFELLQVQSLGGPKEHELRVTRSVLSLDHARRLYKAAVDGAARPWAQRRQQQLGLSSFDEVREYHLATARKLAKTDPSQALELLGPLFFFGVDLADATKLRSEALAELERRAAAARQAAAEQERLRQANAKLRAKEAARIAKARAAIWEGVDRSATLSAAVFDLSRVQGRTVLWVGYAVKNLGGTLHLGSTGGVFWAFRLPGKLPGPGIVAVKGIATGTVDIDDGIRILKVPLVTGVSVEVP